MFDQVLPVPAINSLVVDGVDLTVSGTLTGSVDDYRVELFANDVCDASGFGEGQYFLGSVDVTPAEFVGGTGSFTALIIAPVAQSNITATATNSAGSTSTFAECFDTATSVATFTNGAGGNLWTTPGNWSTGVVPGASATSPSFPVATSATIGVGTDVDVRQLTLSGTLNIDGQLDLTGDSTVSGTGALFVNSGGRLGLDATLTVDGQVVTRELPGVGTIEVGDGGGFDGGGLVANSGVVAFTGTGVTPIGPGLTWSSGANSLTDITSGTVDIQAASFGAEGIVSVAPGAVLRSQTPFSMTDTSIIEFFVDGPASDPANHGRLEVPPSARSRRTAPSSRHRWPATCRPATPTRSSRAQPQAASAARSTRSSAVGSTLATATEVDLRPRQHLHRPGRECRAGQLGHPARLELRRRAGCHRRGCDSCRSLRPGGGALARLGRLVHRRW